MKKILILQAVAGTILSFASMAFAQDTISYFGFKLANLNEPCSFDLDCISEWCKPDSDAEGSARHCAAKLDDGSPCKEAKECKSYSCVIPEGSSNKVCKTPKKYLNLDDPCTTHEECASGHCGDTGYGKVCLLRLNTGESCAGDLQNSCEVFTKCDTISTNTCVAESLPAGETCFYGLSCASGICQTPAFQEKEKIDLLNLPAGQCAE